MRTYWLDVAERALKTAAQVALGLFASDTAGLLEMDWGGIGTAALAAAAASLLTSIASGGIGGDGTASLVPTVVDLESTPEARRLP